MGETEQRLERGFAELGFGFGPQILCFDDAGIVPDRLLMNFGYFFDRPDGERRNGVGALSYSRFVNVPHQMTIQQGLELLANDTLVYQQCTLSCESSETDPMGNQSIRMGVYAQESVRVDIPRNNSIVAEVEKALTKKYNCGDLYDDENYKFRSWTFYASYLELWDETIAVIKPVIL